MSDAEADRQTESNILFSQHFFCFLFLLVLSWEKDVLMSISTHIRRGKLSLQIVQIFFYYLSSRVKPPVFDGIFLLLSVEKDFFIAKQGVNIFELTLSPFIQLFNLQRSLFNILTNKLSLTCF